MKTKDYRLIGIVEVIQGNRCRCDEYALIFKNPANRFRKISVDTQNQVLNIGDRHLRPSKFF